MTTRHLSNLFLTGFSLKSLLHIEFSDLNRYVFASTCLVGTQPHLNAIPSGGGKLLHEPWRIVEGTAGVQSTTALPIPEGIIGIESKLESIFTGSITEVVTPHIGWDGDGHQVVGVGAGTESFRVVGDSLKTQEEKEVRLRRYVQAEDRSKEQQITQGRKQY